jgi:ornithine cyclodeaminase/alanine dehydrogenase-like protein (mu-crystallin family)
MRVLTNDDVDALVSMREAIDLMRDLFAEVGRGSVDIPERVVLPANDGRDAVLFMPGHLRSSRRLGLKVVSVFPANPVTHGLPTIAATVLLMDAATGRVAALVEGTYLTALRTGAVTGLATDLLARDDAQVLGIYGAGAQARTQVEAVRAVRSIRHILVCSPTAAHAAVFASELSSGSAEDVRVSVAGSAAEVAEQSDVIVTATSSAVPVFDGRRLRPGTHVNAIGSFKPTAREVDDATVTRARIFVDHRASAMREAGDLLIPMASGAITTRAVCGDLADLVLGRVTGRTSGTDVTFFKSVGLSAEDLIVAGYALDKAAALQGA